MPTFLDYFGAPNPPHLHGTSLRPAIEANQPLHDALIYGYFGMAVNGTDGRHTYFRNPVNLETVVHAYTAMPTTFHGHMPREQLAQAEMGRFLGHTYNIPLYKVPQPGRPPHRHQGYTDEEGGFHPHHEMFNIGADPGQSQPIEDAALEAGFEETLRRELQRIAAPTEHLARLGL